MRNLIAEQGAGTGRHWPSTRSTLQTQSLCSLFGLDSGDNQPCSAGAAKVIEFMESFGDYQIEAG